MAKIPKPATPTDHIADEPGWEERFQHGLQRALNTPPQHRTKPKERQASKRRIRQNAKLERE